MSDLAPHAAQPVRLFYSYAHEDEPYRRLLDKHLSAHKRTGLIAPWDDRGISPGGDWEKAIGRNLDESQLILLLVSADFLASDYCWGVEMERALAMDEAGSARVIPVMVRPVDLFEDVPFARLQALPTGAKPITEWGNQDAAWTDVARGVRLAAQELRDQSILRAADRASRSNRLDAQALGTLYQEYWTQFSDVLRRSGIPLRPPTPSSRNYARLSLGSSDMRMNVFASVRDRLIGIELVLRQSECGAAYNRLMTERIEIEQQVGRDLEWKELQGSYRIVLVERGYDPTDRADWDRQHFRLIEQVKLYQQVLLRRIDGKDAAYTRLGL